MTATRLAAVTVLSVVALTCDITDVVEPPADSPDAGPWLTAEDLPVVQSVSPGVLSLSFRGTEAEILQQMVAYLDLLRAQASGERAENQTEPEDEREPGSLNDDADLRIVAQTIVESDAPRDPDLVLADEPLVRIGVLDGPMEQIFGNITGAVRLADGSVVVADESIFEIRMFDARGRHLWTRGRRGEGPGEYKGMRLLRGCPGAAITVFDWYLDRITELGLDGSVSDSRTLAADGVNPYQDLGCSPNSDLVFQPWPKVILDPTVAAGEHYRWQMVLNRAGDDGVVTLRSGIPGAERTNLSAGSRPRMWGRKMVFAVAPAGVWYGSSDGYELEQVDWSGRVTRVARWAGPALEVTREDLARYRDALLAGYDDPAERRRFEDDGWPGVRDGLPERFPAYDALVPLPDGSVWVVPHPWQRRNELHLLDPDGVWLRRLTIPAGSTVLDAGPDWVLLLQRGPLDEQSVAVYEAEVSL